MRPTIRVSNLPPSSPFRSSTRSCHGETLRALLVVMHHKSYVWLKHTLRKILWLSCAAGLFFFTVNVYSSRVTCMDFLLMICTVRVWRCEVGALMLHVVIRFKGLSVLQTKIFGLSNSVCGPLFWQWIQQNNYWLCRWLHKVFCSACVKEIAQPLGK